ncbi:hypothetical protein TI39_contig620g00005 [Zymoseptoria brevis]|uniref:Uncharacterized protein n=1 Tax=Zymoseptoria brevis TaxID=1047168 RepID=A0A0F4GGV3_9PEZI|nr:hypothetical protein TI39_contig620g00005 [Zymoseptoria brevis]
MSLLRLLPARPQSHPATPTKAASRRAAQPRRVGVDDPDDNDSELDEENDQAVPIPVPTLGQISLHYEGKAENFLNSAYKYIDKRKQMNAVLVRECEVLTSVASNADDLKPAFEARPPRAAGIDNLGTKLACYKYGQAAFLLHSAPQHKLIALWNEESQTRTSARARNSCSARALLTVWEMLELVKRIDNPTFVFLVKTYPEWLNLLKESG